MSQAVTPHMQSSAHTHHDTRHHASGWVGWIAFASFVMSMLGIFQMIAGLVAIFNHTWYVVNTNQLLVFSSVQSWGWAHLVLGAVIFFAGLSLLSGALWARVIAVLMAGLSAIAYMLSIALYPIWSIIGITVAVLVIYAVLVHGEELNSDARDDRMGYE